MQLDLEDTVARHNAGRTMMTRAHGFIAVVLWPASYLIASFLAWLVLVMAVEKPSPWLVRLIAIAAIAVLAWRALAMRRRLAAIERHRTDFIAHAAHAAPERDADHDALVDALIPPIDALAQPARSLRLIEEAACAAPYATARALHAASSAIVWNDAESTQAKRVFMALGKASAWVDLTTQRDDAAVIPAMERLGLVEHQLVDGVASIRLPDRVRKQYFPKAGALNEKIMGAPRRSR